MSVQVAEYPTDEPMQVAAHALQAVEHNAEYPTEEPVQQHNHDAAEYPTEEPVQQHNDAAEYPTEEPVQQHNDAAEYPTEEPVQQHIDAAEYPTEDIAHNQDDVYPTEDIAHNQDDVYPTEDIAHNQDDAYPTEEPCEAADVHEQLHRPLSPDMNAVHAQLAADEAAEEQEVEAAKAAVEAQAEEEADLDERRQLCSEIVALRKELTIVKEDEANLRAQLVHTAHIIDTHNPALADELTRLEEQAAESQMAHLWHEQCQQHNPDKADWSTININDMPRRVAAAKEHLAETTALAAQLYSQLEVQINKHTDYREEVKTRMQQAYTEELNNTAPARARLHQVEDEKRFHAKRGTTRKPASAVAVVPEEKRVMSRQRRIDTAEVRTAAEVEKLNSELSDLMAECKVLKQRLDNSRKLHAERQVELATALANVRDNSATVRETKERLLKERDELQTLKADLQAVLHYVRAKQREEDAL